MDIFDITEAIISDQINTNFVDGKVIDIKRLKTLWKIVCDENDSQIELISPEFAQQWVSFRDETNNALEQATSPAQVVHALKNLLPLLDSPSHTGYYRGMEGLTRKATSGVIHHVRLEDL